MFGFFLKHVTQSSYNMLVFFQGSPSVLEVDVGSVIDGVICSDFTPVAYSKFFNTFY